MPRSPRPSTGSRASRPPSRATSTSKHDSPPRFHFIGGKGGVGKTTCAAAFAVGSARAGARTLLVSADPAPSLGNLLGVRIGSVPSRIPLARGSLRAVEIDASRALKRWLEPRTPVLEEIALRGTWLDRDDVSRLLGQALPGIDEIAALLEIARLARSSAFDAIVVDTAPTGHTLRMLAMPDAMRGLARVFDDMQAKHRAMVAALCGAWSPDAADALIEEIEADGAGLHGLLRDPARVTMTWVMLPEPMAVEETRDALDVLRGEGIAVHDVVVNRVTPPPPGPCAWCAARRAFETRTIADARRVLKRVTLTTVHARQPEPHGVRALRDLAAQLRSSSPVPARRSMRAVPPARATFAFGRTPADPLGPSRATLVMFGGKGGVGKTTCAAAAALQAAVGSADRRVLLISTDPAHSLADVLGQPLSDTARTLERGLRNLQVRELDAAKRFAETRERYSDAIDALFDRFSRTGPLDASHDRQVMRDLFELAPPGLDELVAVIDVADALGPSSPYDLIVMDTAPSGHALRLLEMPAVVHDWTKALMSILLKYQPVVGAGDLGRLLLSLSQGLGRVRELLADGSRTRFVAVTRAESLPRAETIRLLGRLERLGIAAPVMIVNAVGAGTCRACRRQRAAQAKICAELAREAARHDAALALAPAEIPPPHGSAALRRWRKTWSGISSS